MELGEFLSFLSFCVEQRCKVMLKDTSPALEKLYKFSTFPGFSYILYRNRTRE